MHFTLENGHVWVARIPAPWWRGFSVPGRPAPVGDPEVRLVYAPEGRDTSPLTEIERSDAAWAADRLPELSRAALTGLLALYPRFAAEYGFTAEEAAEFLPPVTQIDGFKPLLMLSSVYVHPCRRDGLPYVGLDMACHWDPEHGVGAMMHGPRVVEMGGADTALYLWIARRDAGA